MRKMIGRVIMVALLCHYPFSPLHGTAFANQKQETADHLDGVFDDSWNPGDGGLDLGGPI